MDAAVKIGLDGVQVRLAGGELDVDALEKKGVKELKREIESRGLEISAVCGDLGGFAVKEANGARIEKTKRIIDAGRSSRNQYNHYAYRHDSGGEKR